MTKLLRLLANSSETKGLGALRGSSIGMVYYALLRLQAAVTNARIELETPEVLLSNDIIHPIFDEEWNCLSTISMSGEAYSTLLAMEDE